LRHRPKFYLVASEAKKSSVEKEVWIALSLRSSQ
jgi:hypothetical protein